MEFTGEFETHITIVPQKPADVETLRRWGAPQGLKCVYILLDRGETPSQPMLTRRGNGALSSELDTAERIARSLNAEGFTVTRIKLEVPPWNPDVPQTGTDALPHSPDRYFEHHIKLLLPPDTDTAPLAELAEKYGAHLSRNALRKRDDGQEERFVTQRCHAVGRPEARQALEQLRAALAILSYPVLEIEEEFVVYDSNQAVDAGWIRAEEG